MLAPPRPPQLVPLVVLAHLGPVNSGGEIDVKGLGKVYVCAHGAATLALGDQVLGVQVVTGRRGEAPYRDHGVQIPPKEVEGASKWQGTAIPVGGVLTFSAPLALMVGQGKVGRQETLMAEASSVIPVVFVKIEVLQESHVPGGLTWLPVAEVLSSKVQVGSVVPP